MEILFEDNHILIINKKPGEIVQGDKTGDVPLVDELKKVIKERDNKPGNVFLGLVHRLDRPTSGIVLFAKTSKMLSRMNNLFRENKVQKKYWAVVNSLPPKESDILTHYIVKNEKQNKSFAYDKPKPGAKEARLSYTLLSKSDRYYLLEIELFTGRHHQIRAQLAAIKCYIKGDLKYGFPRSNPDGGIHLHARKIEFEHPVNHSIITVEAPPPIDTVWDALQKNIS